MSVDNRLPKTIVPSHYNITIQPNLKEFTFEGEVVVDVVIKEPTTTISLHCLDIEVKTATINVAGTMTDCDGIEYREEVEQVHFKFTEEIQPGGAKLIINYAGHLRDNLKGFYRSAQSSGEDKKYAAVTHFEPTGARRAFPCWDEPAVKCTFDITLVVPDDKTALSNMHVIETKLLENNPFLKVVKFATTPKMSTYIIAFIVGDFDYVEAVASNDVIVRVYTSVGKSDQGMFALDFAKKALVFLEGYFKVPYGLKKIDLIGISDFGIGAMENWGLVTYRERYLLVDENTSASTTQFVTEIIAHEFTHNWFGNLVSMEWWTDLWLKEGFANFIEYLCVDNFHPEFDILTQFVLSQDISAQKLDALSNSHPIEVPVSNPSEIAEIFDKISYCKGASVLRMLHAYVGDEAFRKGLNSYLNKFKYSNTVTEDLWKELEISSKKPIREVMSTWTLKMGFPVISVTRESMTADKQVLKFVQKKFCLGYRDEHEHLWKVPINIGCSVKNGSIEHTKSLQSDTEMHMYLDRGRDADWVKLNYNQTDYYRVQYSEELLDELKAAIKSQTLPAVDRLGIQNDLFALISAGYSTTAEYISLLKCYTNEPDCLVWRDILVNLHTLMNLFATTNAYEEFKEFVITLITPISVKIGPVKSEDDDHLTVILRNSVYGLLGSLGHICTVKRFNQLFADLVQNQVPIDRDIRSAVYSTVSCHGDMKIYEQLKQLYCGTDSADEISRLLGAMGKCKDTSVREAVLQHAISDSVRNQDTLLAMSGFFHSLEGRRWAWEFIKNNWDTFITRCEGGHARSRLVKMAIEDFATVDEYDDAKKFMDEHPVEVADRAMKQAFDNIQNNIKWLERLSSVVSIFR